jgi:lipid A 3-O-deacylase
MTAGILKVNNIHQLLSFTLLFAPLLFFAQDNGSAPHKRLMENSVSLQYENDFFNATDMYYTQGINVSVMHSQLKFSPFTFVLPGFKNATKKYYGLMLEQDCFTPRSIRYDTINYLERPYASVALLSGIKTSFNSMNHSLLFSQIDLGIIGPCASCEEEQKGIHRALVNIQPLGWEHQIKTDYVFNYRVKYEKAIYLNPHYELIANVNSRAGTLYTDAGLGLQARIGFMNPYFDGIRPTSTTTHFALYGVFQFNAKLVAYNASMQGGLFNKNSVLVVPEKNINRVVADGLAGAVIAYKQLSFEYSKTFITPEFKGGLSHGWGRCVIRFWF